MMLLALRLAQRATPRAVAPDAASGARSEAPAKADLDARGRHAERNGAGRAFRAMGCGQKKDGGGNPERPGRDVPDVGHRLRGVGLAAVHAADLIAELSRREAASVVVVGGDVA